MSSAFIRQRQQPRAADETAVFVIEPDGWYGMLSLRSPTIRRTPDAVAAEELDSLDSKYTAWLPRLLGGDAITWVSCVPVTQCWFHQYSDGERNDYAMSMLASLSTTAAQEVRGVAVFTGQGDGIGTPIGLQPEQLEPIAAAYRKAQRKLLARD